MDILINLYSVLSNTFLFLCQPHTDLVSGASQSVLLPKRAHYHDEMVYFFLHIGITLTVLYIAVIVV